MITKFNELSLKSRFVLFGIAGGLVFGSAVALTRPAPRASVAAGVTTQSAEERASDPGRLFAHGDELLAAGDGEGALQAFGQVAELEPTNAAALFRLAPLQVQAGALDEALTTIQRARKLQPGSQVGALALARVQLARGDLAAAETALAQVTLQGPERELIEARLALARGDQQAGLQSLQDAARARPNDLPTQLDAGAAALAAGLNDPARVFLGRAVELGGGYDVHLRYAEAMAASDRVAFEPELLAQLNAARQLDPSRPEAFAQLAAHHLALNEQAAADSVIEEAHQRCGDRFDAELSRLRQG